MPTPLIAGNWKMNTRLEDARTLAGVFASELGGLANVEVALFPPFPWLTEVANIVKPKGLQLGAQNMYYEPRGAFTGEVSPAMLQGLCSYVLVGQYERRIHFHDTDWLVRQKLLAARIHGLTPILCVGDTADQREEGQGPIIVAQQLESALEEMEYDAPLVVAYDPVWTTIGRAMPPEPHEIEDMCAHIRAVAQDLLPGSAAQGLRVLYGGSVTPRNISDITPQPSVDGVLVGSSSLSADSFVAIARAFASARADA